MGGCVGGLGRTVLFGVGLWIGAAAYILLCPVGIYMYRFGDGEADSVVGSGRLMRRLRDGPGGVLPRPRWGVGASPDPCRPKPTTPRNTRASPLPRYKKDLNTFIPHDTIGIRSYLRPHDSCIY